MESYRQGSLLEEGIVMVMAIRGEKGYGAVGE